MHRTQISLEETQYRRLTEEARRLGISLSGLIRRLVDGHLQGEPPPDDPLARLAGAAAGDGEAVGRNHNRWLYGENRG